MEFAEAGARRRRRGVIVPDLPLGEDEGIREAFTAAGLAMVPLVAPTTPAGAPRARSATSPAGFIYVVSTVGTTGERGELPPELAESGRRDQGRRGGDPGRGRLRDRRPRSRPPTVGEVADGVIIGSRLVRAAGEGATAAESADEVAQFLAETRVALAG